MRVPSRGRGQSPRRNSGHSAGSNCQQVANKLSINRFTATVHRPTTTYQPAAAESTGGSTSLKSTTPLESTRAPQNTRTRTMPPLASRPRGRGVTLTQTRRALAGTTTSHRTRTLYCQLAFIHLALPTVNATTHFLYNATQIQQDARQTLGPLQEDG